MKKQKMDYRLLRYEGKPLKAKREISYEIKLTSRLILDELCFEWNKEQLASAINRSIDTRNRELFQQLSEKYKLYIKE